jgi:hypothetical protein
MSLNTGNAILSNAIAVDSSYNVGIGGAASGSFKLQVTGTSNLTGALTGTSATFSSNTGLLVGASSRAFIRQTSGGDAEIGAASGGLLSIFNNGSSALSFAAGGAATFSSSVSINTTNAYGKFQTKVATDANLYLTNYNTGEVAVQFTNDANSLQCKAQFLASQFAFMGGGNVGIGVTPNTWAGTNTKALQVYLGSMASSLTFGTAFTFNSYYDGSWRYTGSYSAGKYEIGGNEHIWYTAPDGTAGAAASFTEQMRITSVGTIISKGYITDQFNKTVAGGGTFNLFSVNLPGVAQGAIIEFTFSFISVGNAYYGGVAVYDVFSIGGTSTTTLRYSVGSNVIQSPSVSGGTTTFSMSLPSGSGSIGNVNVRIMGNSNSNGNNNGITYTRL